MSQPPTYNHDLDDGRLEPNWKNLTFDEIDHEITRIERKLNGESDRSDTCTCGKCAATDERVLQTLRRGLNTKVWSNE